jgi:hypothetical protein
MYLKTTTTVYGEHAHDWVVVDGKFQRGKARELTEQERRAHKDIL